MNSLKNFIKIIINKKFKKILYSIFFNKDFILNSPGFKAYFFPINYLNYYKNKLVPIKQISAYDSLKRISSICETLKVNLYAAHGTLLGAIRSESFAGRPKDLDFYISTTDMDIILDNLEFLKNNKIKPYRCKIYKGVIHFKSSRGVPIALEVFKFDESKNKYFRNYLYFVDKKSILNKFKIPQYIQKFDMQKIKNSTNNIIDITLKLEKIEKKIFNHIIKVPSNYLELLINQYGEEWGIPKGKQNGYKL